MSANELPDELQSALKFLLGMEWPEGDVAGLNRISSAWSEFSGAMEQMEAALQRSRQGVLDNMGGEFAESYRDFAVALRETMAEIRTNADGLADVSKNTAADIMYAKVMIIGQLVIMLAMMALEWIPFIGPALAAAAQVIARVVISQILAKVIANILLGAAMGLVLELGLDVAIQGVQMLTGQRTDWNEDFTTGAAISGVVSGAIGGAAGSLLHIGIGKLGRNAGKDVGDAVDELAPPPKTESGGPGASGKGGLFGKQDGPLDEIAPPVKEDGPGSGKSDESGPNSRDENWQSKSWSDRDAKQKWLSGGNFIGQGLTEGFAEWAGEAVSTAASGQRIQEGGLPAFTSGAAQSYLENGLGKGGRSLASRYGGSDYARLNSDLDFASMEKFERFGTDDDATNGTGPGQVPTRSTGGDDDNGTPDTTSDEPPTTKSDSAGKQDALSDTSGTQGSAPPSYEEATAGGDPLGRGRSDQSPSGAPSDSGRFVADLSPADARPPSYLDAVGGGSGSSGESRSDEPVGTGSFGRNEQLSSGDRFSGGNQPPAMNPSTGSTPPSGTESQGAVRTSSYEETPGGARPSSGDQHGQGRQDVGSSRGPGGYQPDAEPVNGSPHSGSALRDQIGDAADSTPPQPDVAPVGDAGRDAVVSGSGFADQRTESSAERGVPVSDDRESAALGTERQHFSGRAVSGGALDGQSPSAATNDAVRPTAAAQQQIQGRSSTDPSATGVQHASGQPRPAVEDRWNAATTPATGSGEIEVAQPTLSEERSPWRPAAGGADLDVVSAWPSQDQAPSHAGTAPEHASVSDASADDRSVPEGDSYSPLSSDTGLGGAASAVRGAVPVETSQTAASEASRAPGRDTHSGTAVRQNNDVAGEAPEAGSVGHGAAFAPSAPANPHVSAPAPQSGTAGARGGVVPSALPASQPVTTAGPSPQPGSPVGSEPGSSLRAGSPAPDGPAATRRGAAAGQGIPSTESGRGDADPNADSTPVHEPGPDARARARVEAEAAERALGKVPETLVDELRFRARGIVGVEHQLPGSDVDRSLFVAVEWMVAQQLHAHGWTGASETARGVAEERAREFAIQKAHEFGTRRTNVPSHGFGSGPGVVQAGASGANSEAGPSSTSNRAPGGYALATGLSFVAGDALSPDSAVEFREQVSVFLGQVEQGQAVSELPLEITVASRNRAAGSVATRREHLKDVLDAEVQSRGWRTPVVAPGGLITVTAPSGADGTVLLSSAARTIIGSRQFTGRMRVPDPVDPDGTAASTARELGFSFGSNVVGDPTSAKLAQVDKENLRARVDRLLEQVQARRPGAAPLIMDIALKLPRRQTLLADRLADLQVFVEELAGEPDRPGSGWSVERGGESGSTVMTFKLVSPAGGEGRISLSTATHLTSHKKPVDVRMRVSELKQPVAVSGGDRYAGELGAKFLFKRHQLREDDAQSFRTRVDGFLEQVEARARGSVPLTMTVIFGSQVPNQETFKERRHEIQRDVVARIEAGSGWDWSWKIDRDQNDSPRTTITAVAPSGAQGRIAFIEKYDVSVDGVRVHLKVEAPPGLPGSVVEPTEPGDPRLEETAAGADADWLESVWDAAEPDAQVLDPPAGSSQGRDAADGEMPAHQGPDDRPVGPDALEVGLNFDSRGLWLQQDSFVLFRKQVNTFLEQVERQQADPVTPLHITVSNHKKRGFGLPRRRRDRLRDVLVRVVENRGWSVTTRTHGDAVEEITLTTPSGVNGIIRLEEAFVSLGRKHYGLSVRLPGTGVVATGSGPSDGVLGFDFGMDENGGKTRFLSLDSGIIFREQCKKFLAELGRHGPGAEAMLMDITVGTWSEDGPLTTHRRAELESVVEEELEGPEEPGSGWWVDTAEDLAAATTTFTLVSPAGGQGSIRVSEAAEAQPVGGHEVGMRVTNPDQPGAGNVAYQTDSGVANFDLDLFLAESGETFDFDRLGELEDESSWPGPFVAHDSDRAMSQAGGAALPEPAAMDLSADAGYGVDDTMLSDWAAMFDADAEPAAFSLVDSQFTGWDDVDNAAQSSLPEEVAGGDFGAGSSEAPDLGFDMPMDWEGPSAREPDPMTGAEPVGLSSADPGAPADDATVGLDLEAFLNSAGGDFSVDQDAQPAWIPAPMRSAGSSAVFSNDGSSTDPGPVPVPRWIGSDQSMTSLQPVDEMSASVFDNMDIDSQFQFTAPQFVTESPTAIDDAVDFAAPMDPGTSTIDAPDPATASSASQGGSGAEQRGRAGVGATGRRRTRTDLTVRAREFLAATPNSDREKFVQHLIDAHGYEDGQHFRKSAHVVFASSRREQRLIGAAGAAERVESSANSELDLARDFLAENPEGTAAELADYLQRRGSAPSDVNLDQIQDRLDLLRLDNRSQINVNEQGGRVLGNRSELARKFVSGNPEAKFDDFVNHLRVGGFDLGREKLTSLQTAFSKAIFEQRRNVGSGSIPGQSGRPVENLAELAKEFVESHPEAARGKFVEHLQGQGYDLSQIRTSSIQWELREAKQKRRMQDDPGASSDQVGRALANKAKLAREFIAVDPDGGIEEFFEFLGKNGYDLGQVKLSALQIALSKEKKKKRPAGGR